MMSIVQDSLLALPFLNSLCLRLCQLAHLRLLLGLSEHVLRVPVDEVDLLDVGFNF